MTALATVNNGGELAKPLDPAIIAQMVTAGDLSGLNPSQKVEYYSFICQRCNLDPATRPFEFIRLNGKLVLYAKKDASEQLRAVHGVSITNMKREIVSGVCIVTVEVRNDKGRIDAATGAVSVEGLKGDALANAMMKAETKAKRRATLSICGLGMLDEAEIEGVQPSAVEIVDSNGDGVAERAKAALEATDAPAAEEKPADPKAAAQKMFLEAMQALSDRDCKGFPLDTELAGKLYHEAVKHMGGKKLPAAEVAQWIAEHANLGLVELDGGRADVELRVNQPQEA